MKNCSFLLPFLLTLSLTVNIASAQTWQWGKRGGSADNAQGSGDYENVQDMATDPKGNVYVLSLVRQSGLNVDGHAKTGYGDDDMMIASFSCNGSYRWSKVIGSPIGDVGVAIKTDTLGGVYILGRARSWVSYGPCHIDSDATVGYNYKNILLVKYDTAGNYKWLTQPEADTVTANGSGNIALDLAVDPNGTSHLLCYLTPGSFAGGAFINSDTSAHILKYDANGTFLGNVTPQITGGTYESYLNLRMIHAQTSDKYYFSGTSYDIVAPALTINNSSYSTRFIVALNATGNFIWGKQSTGYWNIDGRAALDANGRLFIGGSCRNGDSFNGYTATSQNGIYGAPAVSAMDTNGTSLWNTTATSNGGAGAAAIAVNGNEVSIAGGYPGKVKWLGANDSLSQDVNSGYNVFIARLNATTGTYIKQDSLASPIGYNELPSAIVSDRNGNYFVGGYFESQVNVAGNNLISTGGETDFFIAKYGTANCGCSVPIAGYNSNINPSTHTGAFTYTGTATIDSVRWDFGDGTTSSLLNPTHTFANGNFNVCVTAYNSCGSNQYCGAVSLSIANLAALGNVKVYPNPAFDHLIVEGLQGGTYTILNSVGQRLAFGTLGNSEQLNTTVLPVGIYLLKLVSSKGEAGAVTFVKQ